MTQTYLFLNTDDKAKIQKIAQSKNLSLSTCVDIIHKYYFFFVNHDNYYKKGEKQIHIKMRNENKNKTNCVITTNVIYAYLHKEHIKHIPQNHLTKINRKIQSDLDKTYDQNYNKNIIIREMYRAKKQLGL